MADTSFDAVLSTMALMDGPNLPGALGEAFRLLRPGGFLLFSVLNPCFITSGLGWEKDEEGRTTGLRVSRYFDRSTFKSIGVSVIVPRTKMSFRSQFPDSRALWATISTL
ncbi:class I SAM-dependent methyltransferase [Rhizobium giardinii]|uniref:class I SAM-dependent methyltransferase n=1 Tax=Rhizobium giardinii TaxID=56731 RepID=UPI001F3D1E52|nr:methyltransferase domain-containing protein [Rhizobium giardinii]